MPGGCSLPLALLNMRFVFVGSVEEGLDRWQIGAGVMKNSFMPVLLGDTSE